MEHVLYEITEWTIDQVIHEKALCLTVHPNSKKDRHLWAPMQLESEGSLVRFPPETCIFILHFSFVSRSSHFSGAHANEMKHDHSPVVCCF